MDNTNIDNTESTNGEEVVVTDTTEDTGSEVELTLEEDTTEEVDVAKLQEINKKLFARAKKAEELLKTSKTQVKQVAQPKKEQNINNEQPLTREEAILIAKGYEESELVRIKAIAKGNNCSLLDATKDEMFVLWKEKQEVENKKAKSSLGSSKGSGSVRAEKSVSQMTEAEHRAYVNKMFNN
jgi:hypothetical protein